MEFFVETTEKKQVVDITERVQSLVREAGITDGALCLFVQHTTAALTTADLDPGTDKDMLDAYAAMVPGLSYRHPHDPAHVGDHIMSSLIGPSVHVPIKNKALVLGDWQRIVLFEFSGPRKRFCTATLYSGYNTL